MTCPSDSAACGPCLTSRGTLLSAREREVFQGLSVFRGGLSRQAAQAVVGASLGELRALADKSLLRYTSAQRYEVHEIVRQYAAEKLDAVWAGAGSSAQPGTAPTMRRSWNVPGKSCEGCASKPCWPRWRSTARTCALPGTGPWRSSGSTSWRGPWTG